jgi:uncharacterized protein YdhG (YjbR/CyaY superfamily)
MLDFKKTEKQFYGASAKPIIVDVPEMIFITISGRGDPNGEAFQSATKTLYSLSYAIKMANKATLEYVVPPLEGLWWAGCLDNLDKSKFEWLIMLRQPEFVSDTIFSDAVAKVTKKKPQLDLSQTRFEKWTEGLSAQITHIGSYDAEAVTLETLEKFITESGYEYDIVDEAVKGLSRRHHEIYLSDPRKADPAKMRTIIRYPIKKTESTTEQTASVIGDYISAQPEVVQPLLKSVLQTLRKALPTATEKISWQMPTFRKGQNLIHFAAQKHHLGVYPGAGAMEHFAPRLSEYKTSKGAVQFPYKTFGDAELALIAEIAAWCGENNAK